MRISRHNSLVRKIAVGVFVPVVLIAFLVQCFIWFDEAFGGPLYPKDYPVKKLRPIIERELKYLGYEITESDKILRAAAGPTHREPHYYFLLRPSPAFDYARFKERILSREGAIEKEESEFQNPSQTPDWWRMGQLKSPEFIQLSNAGVSYRIVLSKEDRLIYVYFWIK